MPRGQYKRCVTRNCKKKVADGSEFYCANHDTQNTAATGSWEPQTVDWKPQTMTATGKVTKRVSNGDKVKQIIRDIAAETKGEPNWEAYSKLEKTFEEHVDEQIVTALLRLRAATRAGLGLEDAITSVIRKNFNSTYYD